MSIPRNCGTCAFWRAGAFPTTESPAPDQSAANLGVCENIVPQVFIVMGDPVTLQPATHATRCCAEWISVWPGDDEDDDDPDPGEPAPDPKGRVRQLFPITPNPIAA